MTTKTSLQASIALLRESLDGFIDMRQEMKKVGWGDTPGIDTNIATIRASIKKMEDSIKDIPDEAE